MPHCLSDAKLEFGNAPIDAYNCNLGPLTRYIAVVDVIHHSYSSSYSPNNYYGTSPDVFGDG